MFGLIFQECRQIVVVPFFHLCFQQTEESAAEGSGIFKRRAADALEADLKTSHSSDLLNSRLSASSRVVLPYWRGRLMAKYLPFLMRAIATLNFLETSAMKWRSGKQVPVMLNLFAI